MKFTVTFKTPDALDYAIEDAANNDSGIEAIADDEEREDAKFALKMELKMFAEKWVRYGEYINVEFDTDAGTASVRPQ
jgi:hypothetical protein